jgi:uncharacterized coiled-coil DUF342 family protein
MIEIVLVILSTGLGYAVGFKKDKLNNEYQQLDNIEKSINVYNVIIEDLSKKVEELSTHVSRLELQIDKLMKENKELKEYKGL